MSKKVAFCERMQKKEGSVLAGGLRCGKKGQALEKAHPRGEEKEKMPEKKFSPIAQEVLRRAQEAAVELGHDYVGCEHLLLAIARCRVCTAHHVLVEQGAPEGLLLSLAEKRQGRGTAKGAPTRGLTLSARTAVELSVAEAQGSSAPFIEPEHLLMGLVREGENVALDILAEAGVDAKKLYASLLRRRSEPGELRREMPQPRSSGRREKNLGEFTRDLTDLARSGKLDPVIGRDEEIARTIAILVRRTKNNPVLIGEPGVGKTAIVEGLAERIAALEVPAALVQKRVLSLDLASVLAGTKYRGEFEERFKNILEEVRRDPNTILFIDELHTLIGAGSAEGAIDASNLIKPVLGRGEISVIGATTLDEYRRHIERDAALERRFQSVLVSEPSAEQALSILRGLRSRYEQHHALSLSDGALKAAVELSQRYIGDRFLPDKAIDLIDEAASRVRLHPHRSAAEDALSAVMEVTQEDVAAVVAAWTGIPVTRVSESESTRLSTLETALSSRVIGQREAVHAVAAAIRRGRVGIRDGARPVGSFLFLGPTGVGKTELCRALALELFAQEDALLRFDMSEYMEKHSVSRLLGSPPGYVGYGEGGELSEKVRRRPYSLVLFDEIEKAHSDVLDLLLQILDRGMLTDAQGRKVDFRNTVVVMTGNVGARAVLDGRHVGFARVGESEESRRKAAVMEELCHSFRPEFLSRIDETIVFRRLDEEAAARITEKLLAETAARALALGLTLCVEESAKAWLVHRGFDARSGARSLRRLIEREIETALAEQYLAGALVSGSEVVVTAGEEGLCVSARPLSHSM